MSLSQKRWGGPVPAPTEEAAALADELGILPAVARVLLHRGIKSASAARAFLYPSLEQLHSPWLMKGMEGAGRANWHRPKKGQKIVVHGDYDVDGISAAALLVEALRMLGAAAVDFYLPSRFREGYGLFPHGVLFRNEEAHMRKKLIESDLVEAVIGFSS